MYDHTLHRGRKYCLQAFITEKILRCPVKGFLKLMVKKWLRCLKKVNTLDSKIMKER